MTTRTTIWSLGRAFFATLIALLATSATVYAFALLQLVEHAGPGFFLLVLVASWVVAWDRLGNAGGV